MSPTRRAIALVLIPIIVVPLLTVTLGTYMISVNTSIYSNMSELRNSFQSSTVSFTIANRSPVSIPYLDAVYGMSVVIENNTNVKCLWTSITNAPPCNTTWLDVGTINAGSFGTGTVSITADGKPFDIRVTASLNSVVGSISVRTVNYDCRSIGNAYNYTCISST